MHYILPTSSSSRAAASRYQQRQQRIPSSLIGRTAAVAAFTVFVVWLAGSQRLQTYRQPQPSMASLMHGSKGAAEADSWPPSAHAAGGILDSTSSSSSSGGGSERGSVGRTWTHNILARLQAEQQRAQDPVYIKKLQAAAASPINVVIMSGLFWTIMDTATSNCNVDGVPLDCRLSYYTNVTAMRAADALYYHVPSFMGQPQPKAFPTQLRLAMSLESSAYYEDLDDPGYMCRFDMEMSYRHCSQVVNWYSLEKLHRMFYDPTIPHVPFEEKLHAIAYVNSNCGAQSGRSDIMRALMALGDKGKVPVHSYGSCDRNMEVPEGGSINKFDIFSRYKFCVTMENSLRQDYVTEKLYDGLVAGCVPVYLGSSSARDMVPDPHSFIMYDPEGSGDASTPEELDAVMHAIGSNKTRYEAMTAWKQRKPEDQPNTLFHHLWRMRNTTGECALCQFLARHRADPQEQYTTCLFNQDWMATANQTYMDREQACGAVPEASAPQDPSLAAIASELSL